MPVDLADMQLDWSSVALEELDKGICCIIRQATKAYIKLHVNS
jgi:hypothetical protein